MSIKAKAILFITIISLLPIFVLGFFSIYIVKNGLKDLAKNQIEFMVKNTTDEIRTKLEFIIHSQPKLGDDVLASIIEDELYREKITEKSYIFIINHQGQVLLHPKREKKLNRENLLKSKYMSLKNIAKKMISENKGFGEFTNEDGPMYIAFLQYNEGEVISPSARVEPKYRLNWTIGLVIPQEDVLKTAFRVQWIFLGVAFISFIVSICLGYILIKVVILNNINKLANATKQLSIDDESLSSILRNKEIDINPNINTKDEFGLLSDFFKKMISNLKTNFEKIEKQNIELSKSKTALFESEKKYRSIFENAQEGIFQISIEGHFINANKSMARILGYQSPKELVSSISNNAKQMYVNPEDYEAFSNILRTQEQVTGFETQIYRKDGKKIWISISARLARVKTDHILFIEGSLVDISERLEKEIAQKDLEIAEAATKAKSDFLANMSHEIRTPMNAIIGMSHLALKTELTSQQHDYIKKIDTSANSLLGIINDILDFSKIEAGKLDIEEIDFDLSETLSNVANMITVKAQEKETLEVLFRIDPKIPPFLIGDPLRLGQVLVNLGNNAVKFTEKGEIVLTTELMQQTDGQVTIQFNVRDTGIGLTKQQCSKLFTAFSQADSSTSRKYGGTGLGLNISKRLVNMMQGEIWVISEPGVGSEFIFTAKFGMGQAKTKESQIISDDLKGLKVLVVDDSKTARQILIEMLLTFNFIVDQAPSGKKCLELVHQSINNKPYDLIFMDWKMLGMDGIETSKQVLAMNGLNPPPKIILVTAYSQDSGRASIKQIGIDGLLIKPISSTSLLQEIMQAFGKAKTKKISANNSLEAELAQPIRGAHVLVVEDNEINQQVAQEILEGAGLKVTIAENGQYAIDQIHQTNFDIVLMDIQMPVMDGYEATMAIRKESKFDKLPIIAMSANAMTQDKEHAKKVGMNDHVAKPINIKELFTTLVKWIEPKERQVPDNVQVKQDKTTDESTESIEIPDLPGIDVENGLARISGKKKLYMKMLKKFYADFTDTTQQIKKALQDNDSETAERIVHTVKGLSGSIGATTLHITAGDLESAIRQDNQNEYQELIKNYDHELNNVLTILAPHMKDAEDESQYSEQKQGALTDLANFLEELEPHIKKRKPVHCKPIIKKIRSFSWPESFDEELKELDRLVNKYKFKDAINLFKSVKQKLEKSYFVC